MSSKIYNVSRMHDKVQKILTVYEFGDEPGDTFFCSGRGFLETIMASHRFYELLHPQNVTHIKNNKDHKVAPCLQKI